MQARTILARDTNRNGSGLAESVTLALAGMGAATVGGYLGGHLATARKVGTRDPTFARPPVG